MQFYYHFLGERIGPVNVAELQRQVARGVIKAETIIENEKGGRTEAGRLVWLFPKKDVPEMIKPPVIGPDPLPVQNIVEEAIPESIPNPTADFVPEEKPEPPIPQNTQKRTFRETPPLFFAYERSYLRLSSIFICLAIVIAVIFFVIGVCGGYSSEEDNIFFGRIVGPLLGGFISGLPFWLIGEWFKIMSAKISWQIGVLENLTEIRERVVSIDQKNRSEDK